MNQAEYTRWERRFNHLSEGQVEALLEEIPQDRKDLRDIAENRLADIFHVHIMNEFTVHHGIWPKDDDELYRWWDSLLIEAEREEQELDEFNRLLGDVKIDL